MEAEIEVLILFDEEDRDLFHELKRHLTPLDIQGLITIWDESRVVLGTNKKEAITRHLRSASLVLLLLSSHFMASREAYNLAKQALTMHTPPKGYVIPVLLREVDLEGSGFDLLASLPSNGKPIASWENRHAACHDVVKRLREIIAELREQKVEAKKSTGELFPMQSVTIKTPDGSKYAADVPADTLVDRLLRDFLDEWLSPRIGITESMRFSLCTQNDIPLDPSTTLREAGLATETELTLVSKALTPNDAISLRIEDNQGEHYTTVVLLNTVVGQLADAFLRARSSVGEAVVKWIVSATNTRQLKLEETLYNQGVCDNALLRIDRVMTAVEE